MMFITKIDTLDEYDGKSQVILLGDCRLSETIDPERLHRFVDAGAETLDSISAMDVPIFKDGVTLVVSSELIGKAYSSVRLIQKYLVFIYTKYVWFSKSDTAVPDPFALGHDKGPLADLLYQVNMLDNFPYLVGGCPAKIVEGKVPPVPCLLLAPGPSLSKMGPHIKELSKRFLVISLSRSLFFCREHGVTPDIVLQLDTHGEQQNFYPKDMNFSKTWLFALSCAPVRKYCHRFAGVFWIDTFNPAAYGAQYEIRMSWLSSLIPMFGVAELFQAPRILMAGSDLAEVSGAYYNDTDEGIDSQGDLTDAQECAAVYSGPDRKRFPLRLNDGRVGKTRMQFLATAFEAESIAMELTQTAFHNLSKGSALSAEIFPYAPPESFLDEPELNKKVLNKIMHAVLRSGLQPDEKYLQRWLREKKKAADALKHSVEVAILTDPQTLIDNPLYSAGKLLFFLHKISKPRNRFHISRMVIHRFHASVRKDMLLFSLKGRTAMGKTVPVYCYPHERSALEAALAKRFPQAKWEFRNTWSDFNEPLENRLLVSRLPAMLEREPLSLMTRRYAEAADYILDYSDLDSYLIAEDVLEAPWP